MIKAEYISTQLKSQSSKRGFTLIELMVSIAIIAILAAVGLVVYSTAQKTGRVSKRLQDLGAIRTAIELFRSTNGFYPSLPTGTASAGTFVCVDALVGPSSLDPTYITAVPNDPIQSGNTNCYQYTSNQIAAAANSTASATDYKIRTNVPNTEMSWQDINQQPTLIDPDKDTAADDNCVITPLTAAVTGQGWAYYTTTNAACNW